jgi:GNAT superfamily N-acetyltransferase
MSPRTVPTKSPRVGGSTAAAPVRMSVFSAADAEATARLFGDVYARREPLTVAVDESAAHFADWVRGVLPKAAAEGLSIVARRAGTDELLGAMIAEDGATPYSAAVAGDADDPIHALLGGLDTEYRAQRIVRPGEWLHLFLLVVADGAAGQGVATRMIADCVARAARRGWRHAYTEATHPGSQRAFGRLGFEPRLRRDYASWRFRGAVPFAPVAERGGVLLMDRAIDPGSVDAGP